MQTSMLIFNMQVCTVLLEGSFSPDINKNQESFNTSLGITISAFQAAFPSQAKAFNMWGFASNNCEMQLKHVVINETNGGRPWEQPRQTPRSISMELMSLWDWDGVLYSMASHCCFQQTVHHYSVWQESKHCAFKGQEKARPALFVKSLHPASLCCFVFSHIFTLPRVTPCYFTASVLSIQSPAALESWGTFNTCTRNNASLSAPGTEPECCLYELISSGRKCLT